MYIELFTGLISCVIYSNADIEFFGNQGLYEINSDYDSYLNKIEKKSIRRKFLHQKQENIDEENQIKLLEQLTGNKTLDKVYSEDIPHVRIQKYENKTNFENEFEALLAMKGVKYDFKRDFYWRTWRKVKYPNGTNIVVFYKCISQDNESCAGVWTIEEPPCPYEILSMKTKGIFCVVHYSKLYERNGSCPTTIEVNDLARQCRNPIVTQWRFEKVYAKNLEPTLSPVIGQGRERFEILTLYKVNDNEIIFQVINSSHHVIYSRVMRSDGANYACTENCGIINPHDWKITAAEKPLSFDLLPENYKKKRENVKTPRKHTKAAKNKNVISKKRKPHKISLETDDTDYLESIISNDILNSNNKPGTAIRIDPVNKISLRPFETDYVEINKKKKVKSKKRKPHKISLETDDADYLESIISNDILNSNNKLGTTIRIDPVNKISPRPFETDYVEINKNKKVKSKKRKPHKISLETDDTDYLENIINNDIINSNNKPATTTTRIDPVTIISPRPFETDYVEIILDNKIEENQKNDKVEQHTTMSNCERLYQERNNLDYFFEES